ncbi:hypothetical protein SPRG_07397 [Saprolegnia parasitica CBS 223.65]|uniref:SGNH hydrolase-type esterase domain-containing protein n=1 Tax=Saprolegnia parasitica (strain CBS 223.65) TaxID=695850 RepID=A0A067CBE1_SAPPC|nr:hypothetical protein SPRG_07397 [Saprolegnia parasitica CBS 223.65]KDO27798.1 hypothetical protein SPRG_07397 [Saprolegnia parasitica CBS 223.65]|eukprot:XP_012201573.1 hypothetical protein SPRG_07397 [Saprolegnia parasitica CBS 223.65]
MAEVELIRTGKEASPVPTQRLGCRRCLIAACLVLAGVAIGTVAGAAVFAGFAAPPKVEEATMAPTPKPLLLMIGDSITQQASTVSLHGFQALLAENYIRRADVINRGRSGWTTRNYLPTVPAMLQEWSTRPPSLVILELGTNDATRPNATDQYVPPDEYKANLEGIVHGFLDAFPATKFLFLTPAVSDDDMFTDQAHLNARAGAYASLCMEVARRLHFPVVDLWTLLQGMQKDVLSDGLHLNVLGNEFVHDQIMAAIASSAAHAERAAPLSIGTVPVN